MSTAFPARPPHQLGQLQATSGTDGIATLKASFAAHDARFDTLDTKLDHVLELLQR